MFATNCQSTLPIHTFITDVVEMCGGNTRLVRFLNRLGVCASTDTHARYVQYRIKKSLKDGAMSGFPQDSFTVASVDNIDYVHSYARVYCGKQQSSWHGTTIQIVQPQPTVLIDRETRTQAETTTCSDTYTPNEPESPAPAPNEVRLSKRLYSTRSPKGKKTNNPNKHSPVPKRQRRMRTGTEGACRSQVGSPPVTQIDYTHDGVPSQHSITSTINDFKLKTAETKVVQELSEIASKYILQRVASGANNKVLINFQSYFSLHNNLQSPECSNIIYYQVLDQKCDSKETLMNVINSVYVEFIESQKKKWILLEGDQDTYNRLQLIKTEYGNDLSWLIPIPGDWHFLKNYQEVLLKIYLDAGLGDLAKASGYQINSINSNFKRTHHFLIESWTLLFQHFLTLFLQQKAPPDFLAYVAHWLDSFPPSEDQQATWRFLMQLLEDVSDRYTDFHNDFMKFIEEQSSQNQTWKFWSQYVFHDCFAYVALHLAIRSSKWDLRIAAIKSMAAVFTAYDRPNYQKLIAQHINDLLTMPREIIEQLCSGGFTVSILGRPGHSVGIDEAHEMCVNKDCKEFITRPSGDYINRVARFLPVRAKAMKNFEAQLFPERSSKKKSHSIHSIYTNDTSAKKLQANINKQIEKLNCSRVLFADQRDNSLYHLFNNKKATPEQTHDLMNFRQIGQTEFERRVEYYTLRNPSVRPPKRQKRLLTFTEKKSRPKRVSLIEKE